MAEISFRGSFVDLVELSNCTYNVDIAPSYYVSYCCLLQCIHRICTTGRIIMVTVLAGRLNSERKGQYSLLYFTLFLCKLNSNCGSWQLLVFLPLNELLID